MIFDSHAHYNDPVYSDEERKELLDHVFQNGVGYILNAGTNIETSRESIELAEKYDGIYAGVGIYPHECSDADDELLTLQTLKEMASHPKVVSISEIGLDYHYGDAPRELQKKWFVYQLDLASEIGLPVCIHDREAHGDVVSILRDHRNATGMMHSFSGSLETAKELLKLGWYISISGVITFKNAVTVVDVVKNLPPERMLIETDTPYLTPVPYRGKPNNSSYLIYTAEKIAEIKGMKTQDVIDITRENAKRLFNIK